MDSNRLSKLRKLTLGCAILFTVYSVYSCSLYPVPEDYQWEIERTPVKRQGNTGTCWAYGTISLLESECIRKNIATEQLDLSEAYVVYYTFLEKSMLYLKTMGASSFPEAGYGHDVFYIIDKYGIVREADYELKEIFNQMYPRQRLMNRLSDELDSAINNYQEEGAIPEQEMMTVLENIKKILNEEMGAVPKEISYNGNMITPLYYAQNILDIHIDDYVHITSFEHLGFQQRVKLDFSDNWLEYNQFINVDTELFYELTRSALTMQYGLAIVCDITEIGFNQIAGKADLLIYPDDLDYAEIEAIRAKQFQKETTDDHLMHMVGYDETINPWFLNKSSWLIEMDGSASSSFTTSDIENYRGHIHMSKMYFLLKALLVTVHKDMLEYFPEIEL